MTLPISVNDLTVKSDRETVDRLFYNKRFTALYTALSNLDARVSSFEATQNSLVQLGLTRINTILGPLLTTLQEAADLGFLQCKAIGLAESLVIGEAEGFRVTEGAALFTPTPYLLVQDTEDSDNWGVCSLDEGGWTKETGDLALHTVYANKPYTASTSWVISSSSGVLPAMRTMLMQVVAIRDALTALQASISGDVATLEALIAIVQSGPVVSVAGRTGAITLSQSDVSGLVDALAAKAATSWVTTQLAGKQAAHAKLDALVNSSFTAGNLLYASDTFTLTNLPIKTLGKNIINAGSVSEALFYLNVSGYMQELLTSADDAEARALLGVADLISASDSEIWTGTGSNKSILSSSVQTANALVTLTDATTVALDWGTGLNFQVTLTASRALGNPNGGIPGTTRTVLVKGNSASSYTLSFSPYYLGSVPALADITDSRWYLLTIYCVTATHFVVSSIKAKGT